MRLAAWKEKSCSAAVVPPSAEDDCFNAHTFTDYLPSDPHIDSAFAVFRNLYICRLRTWSERIVNEI